MISLRNKETLKETLLKAQVATLTAQFGRYENGALGDAYTSSYRDAAY